MTVRKIHCAGRMIEVSGAGYAPHGAFDCVRAPGGELPGPLVELLRAAALASDARLVSEQAAQGLAWHIEAIRPRARSSWRPPRQGCTRMRSRPRPNACTKSRSPPKAAA